MIIRSREAKLEIYFTKGLAFSVKAIRFPSRLLFAHAAHSLVLVLRTTVRARLPLEDEAPAGVELHFGL